MASSFTIDEALGAVPPEVARLRIKAEVQEFESYQRQRRDQASGKTEPQKEYWMPSAPEAERAAGGALMDAAMAERRGLLQDVMGFLVCDVVGSEDVVAAMNALPAEQDAQVVQVRQEIVAKVITRAGDPRTLAYALVFVGFRKLSHVAHHKILCFTY